MYTYLGHGIRVALSAFLKSPLVDEVSPIE